MVSIHPSAFSTVFSTPSASVVARFGAFESRQTIENSNARRGVVLDSEAASLGVVTQGMTSELSMPTPE